MTRGRERTVADIRKERPGFVRRPIAEVLAEIDAALEAWGEWRERCRVGKP